MHEEYVKYNKPCILTAITVAVKCTLVLDEVNFDKVIGAGNVGQGHWVKVCA